MRFQPVYHILELSSFNPIYERTCRKQVRDIFIVKRLSVVSIKVLLLKSFSPKMCDYKAIVLIRMMVFSFANNHLVIKI